MGRVSLPCQGSHASDIEALDKVSRRLILSLAFIRRVQRLFIGFELAFLDTGELLLSLREFTWHLLDRIIDDCHLRSGLQPSFLYLLGWWTAVDLGSHLTDMVLAGLLGVDDSELFFLLPR